MGRRLNGHGTGMATPAQGPWPPNDMSWGQAPVAFSARITRPSGLLVHQPRFTREMQQIPAGKVRYHQSRAPAGQHVAQGVEESIACKIRQNQITSLASNEPRLPSSMRGIHLNTLVGMRVTTHEGRDRLVDMRQHRLWQLIEGSVTLG